MKREYILEKDGFRAIWFEGNENRDRVIIYMSGARINEKMTIDASKYLRDAGYSILCLGFYLWDGLPKEMWRIPVEYVERAVAELKQNGFHKIAVHGMSTGAGYALLCASFIPDISCVLAVVPYDYVMEGVKNGIFPQNCSVYTWRGKDVPYSKFGILHNNLLKEFITFSRLKNYDMIHMMRYAYDVSEHAEIGRIKVENIHADLLLLGVEADDCWPSDAAVPRMEKILKNTGYPYRVKTHVYEKASHLLGCELPQISKFMKMIMRNMFVAEKKWPAECEKARKDSMMQILAFLQDW